MNKETKIEIAIIVVLVIILGIITTITIKEWNPNNQLNDRGGIRQEFGNSNEEKTEKETKASEYDSCIYSNGKLTIEGNGTLNVLVLE